MLRYLQAGLRGVSNVTDVRQDTTDSKNDPAPTRRVVVRYKKGCKSDTMAVMKAASKRRAAGEPEIKIAYDFDELNTFVVTGTKDEIAMLESNSDVESVEDDQLRFPMAIPGSNLDLTNLSPNGSRELVQSRPYGVDLVQAPELWAQGATGQGVKVCVIDSGIDGDHPDFVSANLDGTGTWFQDGCGHGTHVSGTVVGRDDDFGVVGVAPNAELFTVRVFGNDCGPVFSSGIYEAAKTCQNNGADIISMSLGGPVGSAFESSVFDDIFASGVLVVAAAGNDGDTSFSFPASYNSVMSVGAVNANKRHASFSQRNSQIDIAAPGVAVLSTFPQGGCSICRGSTSGFGAIDGTSMATPHVSGVAALLKSAIPTASAADLRNAIEASAEDLGSTGRDDLFGHGLVQGATALQMLTSDTGAIVGGVPGGTDSSTVSPNPSPPAASPGNSAIGEVVAPLPDSASSINLISPWALGATVSLSIVGVLGIII